MPSTLKQDVRRAATFGSSLEMTIVFRPHRLIPGDLLCPVGQLGFFRIKGWGLLATFQTSPPFPGNFRSSNIYLTDAVTENGTSWMKQAMGRATHLTKVHLPGQQPLRNLRSLSLTPYPRSPPPNLRQLLFMSAPPISPRLVLP